MHCNKKAFFLLVRAEQNKKQAHWCYQCVYLLRSNRSIQYQINVNSIWYFFIVWNNYFRNWIDTRFDDQIWRIKSSVNFGDISDVICIVKLVNSIVRSLSNRSIQLLPKLTLDLIRQIWSSNQVSIQFRK